MHDKLIMIKYLSGPSNPSFEFLIVFRVMVGSEPLNCYIAFYLFF